MLAALNKANIWCPPFVKEHIWTWVGKYPVDRVQKAARTAADYQGRSLKYVEQILEGERASGAFPDEDSELIQDVEEYLRRRFDGDDEV